MKYILFRGVLGLIILLVLMTIGGALFMYTSPEFGQSPEGEDLERMRKSRHYADNKFRNIVDTSTGDVWEALKSMPTMMFGEKVGPVRPLPTAFEKDAHSTTDSDTSVYITWYGHSAFLIELAGKRILIDPMLGDVAAPVPFGTRRFAYQNPIPLEELNGIDLIIISHDHYDHLDYPTIAKLKDRVGHFITPLGVGSHLKAWGIAAENITELDWWENTNREGISFTACPSRHFSGRGFSDRDATQWASWVLSTDSRKLYFSGDGGYGKHFSEIADRFGTFDFAMLECGQYNKAWSEIHMMPEETVQAGLDLHTALAMPIHWGAFRLAPHAWTDPITRFSKSADQKGLSYIVPIIGQRFELGKDYPRSQWWLEAM
ncbi:MBL fold metallo-hydrolase [Dyadobacter tibetensis]|uniref:MBL fold metallo-hydrolase n=1 Tax=Dyadobacter tibetensis TaxID=1211851 RepID=UPI000471975F|nr:MBL fold metallo-hydrolase [Dyadobacter tibetensis]